MSFVAQIISWEIRGFLLAMGAIIAAQLVSGQISTRNLLHGRIRDTGELVLDETGTVRSRKTMDTPYFSPERVQLMLFTIYAGFYYLSQVLNNPNPGSFPPIPTSWTAVMAGSNVIYLGGKAVARFWPWTSTSHGE